MITAALSRAGSQRTFLVFNRRPQASNTCPAAVDSPFCMPVGDRRIPNAGRSPWTARRCGRTRIPGDPADASSTCPDGRTCPVTRLRPARPVPAPAISLSDVRYANTVVDLIGNTPLVKLGPLARDLPPLVLAKVEYVNPGGSVKDRIAREDDRRGRGVRRTAARRHHRRADQRQHRRRAGAGRPAARLPLRLRLPGQGQRGQAQRAARLRRRGRGVPDGGGAGGPGLVLLGVRPAGARDRRRVEARPVLEPAEPGQPLRDDRPGDLGRHRRQGHALRRRASAPAARSPAPAGTSRRCPAAGCRSSAPTRRARCTPAAPGGRTWSRASARTSGRRPTTGRWRTRSSRSPTPSPSR